MSKSSSQVDETHGNGHHHTVHERTFLTLASIVDKLKLPRRQADRCTYIITHMNTYKDDLIGRIFEKIEQQEEA